MYRIFLLFLMMATVATAAVYKVGPGQACSAIGDVPLESLSAGDSVCIYYRSTAYREKWVIGAQGTSTDPVVFIGVADINGNLPVIDGENAVTRTNLDYWNEDRGVIKIGGASTPSATPAHIIVENLEIRCGRPPYTFRDDGGTIQPYRNNAASIHVEEGEHISIRNCVIHDSGNGIFVTWQASDVLIEGCNIYDNGIEYSIYEHNTYTEAAGITYQYNRFGPLRANCGGNNLKDRSAGTVIRYNWIEGGNRQLDLVDSDHSYLYNSSDYDDTFVYGNILYESTDDGNSQIVHFGGDSGDQSRYRGALYFYHNTVVSGRSGNTTLLRLSSNAQSCDCRNNILYVEQPGYRLAMSDAAGQLDLLKNAVKPGWVDSHSGLDPGASVSVVQGNMESTEPGFIDAVNDDFHLASSSICISAATSDAAAALSYGVIREYMEHQSGRDRIDRSDIGAFDYVPDAALLRLKLCLQGAYDPLAFMHNDAPALLPVDSPYESAAKQIDPLPDDAIDWVLVELRTTAAAPPVYQFSFLLAADGNVLDVMNGNRIEPVRLEDIIADDYHVAVKHRNHKTAVSAQPFSFSRNEITSISFYESSQIYHDPKSVVFTPTGVWCLCGGDLNQDGRITSADYTRWYNAVNSGDNGYESGGDMNFDGQVDASDYLLWHQNAIQGY
jgi:hypothetical protein